MRPRWKKVIADFWENKARSFLIIASISVGIFAVGVVGIGYLTVPESILISYESTNPANIQIQTDLFDDDFVNTIQRIDQVQDVEGRMTITAKVRNPESGDWQSLSIIAMKDLANQRIKILNPETGKSIPGKEEMLLTTDSLDSLPIDLESSITIKLSDGTQKIVKIVGTVHDYSSDLAITFGERIGFISIETLDYLYQPRKYNSLVITVKGNQKDLNHIEKVAGQINEEIENSGRRIYSQSIKRSTDQPFANYTNAIIVILGFIGIFILVLSSALIINTMNALMAQHIRQIGVMKLVGGLRNQVIGMYLVLVLFLSFISIVIAIPASAFVGRALAANVLPVLNSKIQSPDLFIFIPEVILIQVLVAFVIPLLAALSPIIQGASIPLHKALTASLIKQNEKISRFNRWIGKLRSKDGIILLGIRNTFRQMNRLLLTIFTLSLGCAIFISVFNVELSLTKQIDRVIAYNQADIYLNMAHKYPTEEIIGQLLTIPGIEYVEGWLSTNALLKSPGKIENVSLVAPPEDSDLVSRVVNMGRWVFPDEKYTVAVNDAFWNTYPDLKPGDQFVLDINGKEEYWTIVGIFHYTGLDQKYAFTSFNNLSLILNSPNHAISYRVVTKEHNLAFQTSMASTIDNQLSKFGYDINTITAREEITNQGLEKINVLIYVLIFLSILTGIVGGIGLSGTLSLNVMERTAEIGILRAIGAHNTIIIRLVMFESFIICITSYVFGIIASFPISYVLTNLVNQAIFKAEAAFVFTSKGMLIWLLILAVLSFLASYIPARNAARLTIREVLAYE